jgi:acyl-CoA reductase-like NAD-dependent aldehyde dehydrogenase
MSHIDVLKTYKLYIGGAFPRTESGRYYKVYHRNGELLANMCLASRKDVRNAVVAARQAFTSWSNRAAYNRGQILYRIAEMLEGRKAQFVDELVQQGSKPADAQKEVRQSIDRCVYYSGWCDKYQAVFSSVNPVNSAHFNFSVPEPMGVVTIIAPETPSLLGLLSTLLPVIAGGNTCVILASETKPLCAITLAEVLATSDLPGGVVNILTGRSAELHTHISNHMDVNAVIYCRENATEQKRISENASINVKRSFHWLYKWTDDAQQNPYLIMDVQEIKTTWHPIEQNSLASGKY